MSVEISQVFQAISTMLIAYLIKTVLHLDKKVEVLGVKIERLEKEIERERNGKKEHIY